MIKTADRVMMCVSRRDFVKSTVAGMGGIAVASATLAGVQTAIAGSKVTAEEQEVLNANARFYSALQDLNLEKMDGVWLQEDWVRCVHPGRDILNGWEAIRKSWKEIFESTSSMRVTVAIQLVHVENSSALVCCTEKLSTAVGSRIVAGYEQSTNVFERRRRNWLLVHHHASPLPFPWPGDA